MKSKAKIKEVIRDQVATILDIEDFHTAEDEHNHVAMTKGYDLMRDGTSDSGIGIWGDEVKAFLDLMTLKGLFFSEAWVYIVVDLVASKLANLPLNTYEKRVENGKENIVPVPTSAVTPIVDSPNKFQDYMAWMYTLVADLTLLGNSIQWGPQVSNMMLPIPAESINIEFDPKTFQISQYVSYSGTSSDQFDRKVVAKFNPADICHIRRPNPGSLLWGLSPFVAGRKGVLFNRYSSEYLNNFYLKGATSGLALEMSKEANEKVALRLLRSFENAYTGRRNQRRTMVLPKGVQAKQVAQSLSDQLLPEMINMNREDILALLKVPKHEVGLQTQGSLGSEEFKQALKNFWVSTLKPTGSMVAGALTKFWAAKLGPNQFVDFDYSGVEILKDDEMAKAKLATEMKTTHTLNEVRAKVYGDPPLEGGDVTPPQGNTAPQTGAPQQGTMSLSGQEVAESNGALPSSEKSVETKDAVVSVHKDKVEAFKKSNDGWFARREAAVKEVTEKAHTKILAETVGMFAQLSPTFKRIARKYIGTKAYASAVHKADDESKLKVTDRIELRRKLREAIDKFESSWVAGNVKTLESVVDTGYDVTLKFPFNLPSEQEIAAIRERGIQKRRQILEDRGIESFANMNETTTDKVLGIIQDGIANNKTIDQIADDIGEKFSKVEGIKGRAETIARTETLTAVSLGQAAAMQDAASVIPNLKKMWLSADDDRVRDSHRAVDGEVQAWDDPFTNQLYFPHDPQGPAEEVINCRCTFVALPADQMQDISGDNLPSNEGDL